MSASKSSFAAHSRIAECLLAAMLAWQAQNLLRTPAPVGGLALLAAAAALFAHSVRGIDVLRSSGDRPTLPFSATARALSQWSMRLVLGALALSGLSLGAFAQAQSVAGWALTLAAVAVFLIALRGMPAAAADAASVLRSSRFEWLLLAALLAVALVPRLVATDRVPAGLWYDEAREGVAARQVLADPSYRPVYIPYIERPAHHVYLVALSFMMFGDTVPALRAVAAAFSLLNMLAAYLLLRRWFARGAWGGLLAAALLATMRYDLTLSRILFDANTTPFFMFMSLFFLDRGLHRQRPSDFALAGLIIGIGLGFYLPMRLYLGLVIAMGIGAAALAGRHGIAALAGFSSHAALFVIGVWLAIAPVVEYAVTSPDVFFERTGTASVLYEREETDLGAAVWTSVTRQLGMYNVRGDNNGRHNLPGAPMFDDLTGVLFLLGGSLVILRARQTPNLVMFMIYVTMMQAAVFATDWEAPHALRAIGTLPAALYACTYALTTIASLIASALGHRRMLAAAVVALLIILAWTNLDTYFNRQSVDDAVWRVHSIAETWTASEMRRLAPTHTLVLTDRYREAPTIRFLAPGLAPARYWAKDEQPPLIADPARPTALFLDDGLAETARIVMQAYPNAKVSTLAPPHGGEPLVYEIVIASQNPR